MEGSPQGMGEEQTDDDGVGQDHAHIQELIACIEQVQRCNWVLHPRCKAQWHMRHVGTEAGCPHGLEMPGAIRHCSGDDEARQGEHQGFCDPKGSLKLLKSRPTAPKGL